ncbi:MAG: DUF2750 domain-containing protein [Bacteroidales bacterium]|nr:DUF2750 domain-containing protein [Bacteroidales bacterium]
MKEIRKFLQTVNTNGILWLLEAKPGLFAMLEDGGGNSYIPVWASEDEAKANISEDWESYKVANMDIAEFITWTRELDGDNVGIAISAGNEGQIFPIPSKIMRQMLGGQEKSDRELVGEEFYDEEWAEPMPEDWEDEDEN